MAIEVTAGTTGRSAGRHGLCQLRSAVSDRFTAGVVLHTGAHRVRYSDPDDRIIALPIDPLWS